MAKPVVTATTLVTEDGVPIEAIHLPGPRDLAVVVAHGFTLSWQRPNVWRIANRFNRTFGVLTFDFRGHGRSGGLSTLGDRKSTIWMWSSASRGSSATSGSPPSASRWARRSSYGTRA
jgi:pimeloyl-ACP methyl ester carboxylesterase